MLRLAAAAALVVLASSAHARPPAGGGDPALAPWFEDLRQPGTGRSCCSIADCRMVDARIVKDHYEAFVDDRWMVVPPETILRRYDNPTGHAVVCWTPALGIMCFVEGPGV